MTNRPINTTSLLGITNDCRPSKTVLLASIASLLYFLKASEVAGDDLLQVWQQEAPTEMRGKFS